MFDSTPDRHGSRPAVPYVGLRLQWRRRLFGPCLADVCNEMVATINAA